MTDSELNEALRGLIRLMLQECGMTAADHALDERDFDQLWPTFRALANTRAPMESSPAFLEPQDRVLRELIARAGVTEADELPRTKADARLSVWRGDITTLRADAIVNAANAGMTGCWSPNHHCIDNAIHTFAGVQLRLECARLMESQGHSEPTGLAKSTAAYNLPAKHVIHTVGPIANGAPTDEHRAQLASSYHHCLDEAARLGCASLAFCCISTGVFGFPQREAAAIAVRETRAWLDEHADAGVTHVVFNVFGDKDERIYHALLDA
ncbi:protein-ADP-ribose hydrolase [Bifidobacterium eulemuris]|uniref:Phosphatase n=1 Tax=Bifidobacterium eulemuris TaxID=1765219 RepID=A0A261GAF6_9BIFI|nr:protein-ADP-ribose hydrolase [Bifidobacterium eulemuris]OZG68165.1 phosphatase [Bifidobacterium eulemuris]QOL31774.1 protein-ADP-ribose hydrolase [Bifidobacterium eulemuris]